MLELIDVAKNEGISDGLYLRLCNQLQLIRNMCRSPSPSLSSTEGSDNGFNFEGEIWRRHSL